ncbi:GNAT family N-acetyltransferase [Catellatospora citrea]|uniref:N-acetyltransferase n=1 Tax=Catellatospora citrea TaxID=53366 RepID=A0A8J3KDB2_9ACTN|nr:GNAT family N-acetyltransferase [Catellatospora citrea]RKE10758.1 RimJ/RimL family protein N-acetyltransferase [Catellatospora citrea]GIG01107.1 N-acetyltransferase [Catellatospora citrea]
MRDIVTERLVLRDWRESDLRPWAAINADPQVCEHLGPVWDVAQSAASIARYQEARRRNGFGSLAVELAATGELIGLAGIDPVAPTMPFTGVEIGWRLARSAWGHGYASEAARAVLDHGFTEVGLPEIVAVTLAPNLRSQAVMRRIGMTHAADLDFDHQPEPHGPVFRHVVHRIIRPTA